MEEEASSQALQVAPKVNAGAAPPWSLQDPALQAVQPEAPGPEQVHAVLSCQVHRTLLQQQQETNTGFRVYPGVLKSPRLTK